LFASFFIDLWGNADYTGLSKVGTKIIVVNCNSQIANIKENAKLQFVINEAIHLTIVDKRAF